MGVSDVDDTEIASGSVSVSTGFTAGDTLAATTTGTSVTASYNLSTGVLSLSGTDTLANYQGVLQSVTYSSTSEDITATATSRTITFGVTDANSDSAGAQSGSATRSIAITAVNDAPTITTISNQTTLEDAATGAIVFSLADHETAVADLTLTGNSSNTALVPDNGIVFGGVGADRTLTITPTPNQNGTLTVTVTVSDGETLSTSTTFDLTVTPVNDAPTLAEITDPAAILEDAPQQSVSLTGISAGPSNETQTLTVTATSSDTALVPDPTVTYTSPEATATLTYTPAANANGTATITVVVSDDGGTGSGGIQSVTKSFTVTVTAVNDAPILAAVSNQSVFEDAGQQTISLSRISAGPANENQAITITASSSNTSLIPTPTVSYNSPNPTGSLTYTPVANGNGLSTITLTVHDDGGTANGGASSLTRSFTIQVNASNDEPVLSPISDYTVVEGSVLEFSASAGDVDGDSLTFSLSSGAPAGASIDSATGVFRWIPSESQGPGNYTITVAVSDNGAPSLTVRRTFQVAVSELSSVPIFDPVSDQTVSEGETLSLTLTARDADLPGQTLSFSLGVGHPAGMTLQPTTGLLTWATTETDGPSTNIIEVRVVDSGTPPSESATRFTVIVNEVNQPPVMPGIRSQLASEGTLFTLAHSAIDPDAPANVLTWSLSSGAPKEMTIDPATGTVSWTPAENDGPSTHEVTVTVTDNGKPNASASQTFTIAVLEVNQPPTITPIPDQTVAEGNTLTLTVAAADPDQPANKLLFSLGAGAPSGATINSATGLLSWTPDTLIASSTNQITVQVADDGLPPQTAETQFTVIAVAANSAPILSLPSGLTVAEDSPLAVSGIGIQDADSGAGTLQITLSLSNGQLSISGGDAGVTVSGNGSGSMALTGKLSELNAALQSITYRGQTNFFGSVSLSGSVNDQGNTGGGGALSDTKQVSIQITPVNDLPSISPIADQTTVDSVDIAAIVFSVADVETNGAGLQVTAGSSNPTLVAESGITLSGQGSDRTVSIHPTPGQAGESVITLTVADPDGGTAQTTFNLTVTPARPVILSALETRTVLAGNVVALTVSATGTAPLEYQWRFKDTPIPGATGPTLNLTNVQPSESGLYSVAVSNSAGSTSGNILNLTVAENLGIVNDLQDQTVIAGTDVTFQITAGGLEPLQYKWRFNGQIISGATSSTLSMANVQPSDAGLYSVEVSNATGSVSSREANLVVEVIPLITREPEGQMVTEGTDVSLGVTVSGTEPLIFQWKLNGADMPGATDPALSLSSIRPDQAGDYQVTVSNAAGAVTSATATIGFNTPVLIADTTPKNLMVPSGEPVTLSVSATGTAPLLYQWFLDGTPVSGGTGPDLVLTNPQIQDTGRYTVVVRNSLGAAEGPVINLQVVDPVVIVQDPQDLSVKLGETATFTVQVTGTGPFGYVWEIDGVPFRTTTGPSLVLPGVKTSAAGGYGVTVNNIISSAKSSSAQLTVVAAPTVEPLPSIVVLQQTKDNLTLQAVAHGTPPFRYQWLLNGVTISGATNDTYTVLNVQPPDGGGYSVVVTDSGGAVTSNTSTVIVDTPAFGFADNIASASTLTATGGCFTGSNAGATRESGEPAHVSGKPATSSVWLLWESPGTGIASINLRGSSFDTIMAVYTGTPGSLTQISTDEDGGGFLTSAVSFNTAPGISYYIAIDGFKGAQGNIQMCVNWEGTNEVLPVVITHPQSQTVLVGDNVTLSAVATISDGSPLVHQWFFDGDAIPGATDPILVINNIQGQNAGNYRVEVRNVSGSRPVASFDAVLQVNLLLSGFEGPQLEVEDKFGATSETGQQIVVRSLQRRPTSLLRGFRGWKYFSTKTASKDAGEPNHANNTGGASSWFVYEGVTNSTVRISTEGSSFDTVLAAYTGATSAYVDLVEYASDDNSGTDGKSSVLLFPTERGQIYYIAMDGFDGAKGLVQFKYEVAAPPFVGEAPKWGKIDPVTELPIGAGEDPTLHLGDSVRFTIKADNVLAPVDLTYQWRLNGLDIPGADVGSLVLKNLTARDAGDYQVVAGNFSGSVTSAPVHLDFTRSVSLLATLEDRAANVGGSATFSVIAEGTGPLEYHWTYNGAPIAGASSPTLRLDNVQPSSAGQYAVEVTNSSGSASSQAALTVNEAPIIVSQPQPRTVPLGDVAQFTVSATGTAPLSYQWRFNGVNLKGATQPLLTLENVQPTQEGNYSVVVSNLVRSVTSVPAPLAVATPLAILQQPADLASEFGATATFSVIASGNDPLAYQWRRNGQDIPGAISPTLVLSSVTETDVAVYQVVVRDSSGTLTSREAQLMTGIGPRIVEQPVSQTVKPRTRATFSVTAEGTGPLRYQWSRTGVAIPGATNTVLEILTADSSTLGDYRVIVQNRIGSVVSDPAVLDVLQPPRIVVPPDDVVAPVGGTATFRVQASGSPELLYQWYFGDAVLLGATNTTYFLREVHLSQEGRYRVKVTNPIGSVISEPAHMCVVTPQSPIKIVSVKMQLDGVSSRVLICGPNGTNAILQASSNLRTWRVLTPFTFTDTGYQHIDEDAGLFNHRFYKVSPREPVRIIKRSGHQAVPAGTATTVWVETEGTEPITYQWSHNGIDVPGATNEVLSIEGATMSDAGSYRVRMVNSEKKLTSPEMFLCVRTDEETVRIMSARLLEDGMTAQVLICGPVGLTGILHRSQDLKNWEPLGSFTFLSSLHEYLDSEAGQSDWRFYKVAPAAPEIRLISQSVSGQYSIDTDGPEGFTVVVATTTDLTTWTILGSYAITGGKVNFSDPDRPLNPHRFYKIGIPQE
ncbi:MAG: immunoglobulin domain-containing protein [Verrucomicrobia bacterium]|nr:immunoglobulin domain-containing protein [Verrucomicrobiota bacterium]